MKMALCKSVHGRWNYCPFDALKILGTSMQYGDDGFPDREAALNAAKRDKTIPRGAEYVDVTDWGSRDGTPASFGDLLRNAGFSVWDTGGHCSAWRAELANGAYILITDDAGATHTVGSADKLVIGIYGEDDVTLAIGHGDADPERALEVPTPAREYVLHWGEGYGACADQTKGLAFFTCGLGYDAAAIAQIQALDVGQTADLSDPSGEHTVRRSR